MWGIKTDHCQEVSSRMKSFFLIEFKHKIDSFIEVKSWTLSEKKRSPTIAHTTNVAARGVLPSLTKVHRVVSLPIENRFQKPLSFLISFPSNTPKSQIWADPRFGMRTISKEHSEKKKGRKESFGICLESGSEVPLKNADLIFLFSSPFQFIWVFLQKKFAAPYPLKRTKKPKMVLQSFSRPSELLVSPTQQCEGKKRLPSTLLTVKLSI